VVKLGIMNKGLDHLSRLEHGEEPTSLEDTLPDAHLLAIMNVDDHFTKIVQFLSTGMSPREYTIIQKKQLVVRAPDFSLIAKQIYNMGLDEILRRCVMEAERPLILVEAHEGITGGHYTRKETTQNILRVGLWWPTLHKDAKDYYKACDVCQQVGKPSKKDEMPLSPQLTLQEFEKWAIDFVGPINPLGKRTRERYIITVTEYLTRWAEATEVKECSETIAARFIFDDIITRFGFPKILMSDQGTHFINKTIEAPTEEFAVHHQKSTPYHPQVNGTVEAFNKILETTLTNIYSVNRDVWDLRVPVVLWAYRTTCKKLTMQTPVKLVYGIETVVPMEHLVPRLIIASFTDMDDIGVVQDRLAQLVELEEDRFIGGFHQQVHKEREKAYHDRHIKKKTFK
jgi:transposase InsO family protein